MIVNCSRVKVARTCWRKTFNNFHRMLEGGRSFNLIDGGAFHEAVASGLATPSDHDWSRALKEARVKFDAGVQAANLMDVELWKVEQHWAIVEKMVEIYREHYGQEEFQIIQPECSFDIALPDTHHNCIFVHHREYVDGNWVEKWGTPDPDAIMQKRITYAHGSTVNGVDIPNFPNRNCACYQPHRLVGKTDALMRWRGGIWLMEHKTSAIRGPQFWDQWELDIQPTTYMYGIWRALNFRPRGFVLDMIFKPSENQVESWNSKRKYGPPKNISDYMDYERQSFLRTEEDLLRVERQYIEVMNEWESRIAGPLAGQWPLANVGHACKLYNRKCDYWTACLNHDQESDFSSMSKRAPDYVNQHLTDILVKISGGTEPASGM